jgi:DNA-binding CsgD family transcriptional regulator
VEGWARRLTEAADHYLVAGDPGRTAALLNEVVARLEAGVLRARALSLLAWTSPGGDLAAGVRLGEQALAEAGGVPGLEAITSLRLGLIEEIRGNLNESMAHRLVAAALAESVGDLALMARALSAVGFATAVRDCVVAEASRRAVEIERSLPEFLGQYSPSIELGQVLMYAGEVDEARTVLEAALERAIAAGDEAAHCNCLYRLAALERRTGNWARARVFSNETRELNAQAGNEQEYASCLAVGALLDAGTGRVDEAREAANLGLAAAERMDDAAFAIQHRGVLGFVELSLGDAEAAQAWLAPGTELLIRQGFGEVSMYPAFQHDVDAAVQAGNLERAELLVAHLERLAARTGRSWTQAIALRGRGLILAAHGDLDAARASLQRAVLAHQAVLEPLELARTLLALGKLERRAKRKRASRDALERAAAIFASLPAPLWQAKVDDELARLGVRAAPGGLTETEARIAELAASGMTNPEIAAAAFVSRKTVEANLSRVYRKLGVRSRVELARRLPTADT